MSPDALAQFAQFAVDAAYLALRLAAPAVLAVAAVGFVMGVVQTAAQSSDASLGFAAKLAAAGTALFFTQAQLSDELLRFSGALFRQIVLVAH
jgi:type III secretory pathway component EscS